MLLTRLVSARPTRGWMLLGLTALAVAVLIAGCGGGVGVGGTGAYASGPIGGFGSVVVNGIHFDDSSAGIFAEDGTSLPRASLGLGMFAEVDSGAIGGTADAPTAVASRIRISSQLIGSVTALLTDGFAMVGQSVRVTAATVFGDDIAAGLPALALNDALEVYGFFDAADGRMIATRVEKRSSAPALFKVRGVVANLSASSFTIGAGSFSYAGAPAGLADGAYLAVQVQPVQVNGAWVVTGIGAGQTRVPDIDRAELYGSVTALTSATSFSVNGQPVDAAGARFDGDAATLALGVRVEVRGAVAAGVLHASRVKIEDDSSGGSGTSNGAYELKGAVSALDTAAKTFVVQGFTIRYDAASFERGVEADLGNGDLVEVRANPTTSANTLSATRVKFDA